jgi:hypothetical protein
MSAFPEEYVRSRAESAGFDLSADTLEKVSALISTVYTDFINGNRNMPPSPCPKVVSEPV